MEAQNAENFIVDILLKQQWQILAKNFRHIGFEVDIIATKNNQLIAVEVKWRKNIVSLMNHHMQTMVSRKKLQCVARGLNYFASRHHLTQTNMRIDLVILTGSRNQMRMVKYFADVFR